MRVANWRAMEIFGKVQAVARQGGSEFMDDVVVVAKAKCPVGTITRIPGDVSVRHLRFTPKRSRGRTIPVAKRKEVAFTVKHWTGRIPGTLQASIRKVLKESRPDNIRVYAGHFKAPYAHFVEYGTVKMKAQPFMRPTFNTMKGKTKKSIEESMRRSPEAFK